MELISMDAVFTAASRQAANGDCGKNIDNHAHKYFYCSHNARQMAMRRMVVLHQALLDSVPAVVYRLSLQGDRHLVHISPRVSALGISADKWGSDAELHHRMCYEEDRPSVKRALEHSYTTGAEFQCEYRIHTSANNLCWFQDQAKVVMDKNGQPLFLQGVMMGIKYPKSLESELTHYRCMFEKMVCEKTERLNQRLAILESCNLSLRDNYHQMRQMYLDLLAKNQALESGTNAREAA